MEGSSGSTACVARFFAVEDRDLVGKNQEWRMDALLSLHGYAVPGLRESKLEPRKSTRTS